MKSSTIKIEDLPVINVHLVSDAAELTAQVLEKYDLKKEQVDLVNGSLAGLTVGTSSPDVNMYICDSFSDGQLREIIIHESVHAANCLLRWKVCGSMERHRMLAVSDVSDLHIPGFESFAIKVHGIDEEDQANLIAMISETVRIIVTKMRLQNGKEKTTVQSSDGR